MDREWCVSCERIIPPGEGFAINEVDRFCDNCGDDPETLGAFAYSDRRINHDVVFDVVA